jgi:hypothetical protein
VILLIVGALSILFVRSNDSSFSSQREINQLTVLQQQIEKVRQAVKQYGFSAIALNASPQGPTDPPIPADPTNPNDFVSASGCGASFEVESNYNATAEAFPTSSKLADNPEPLLVNGCAVNGSTISGGQLSPVQYSDLTTGATSASPPASDPYATVYTYVTQTQAVGCNTALGACGSDARRVVFAVVLQHAATDIGANYPTYSTTVFVNPIAANQPTQASGLRILGFIP